MMMALKKFKMKDQLKTFLTATSVSIALMGAPQAMDNNPFERFAPNITNGIDVYLAPKLLNQLGSNLDQSINTTGIDLTKYTIETKSIRTGVKKLDQIVTNPKLLKSIKSLKYQFRKFFEGIWIKNQHDLEMNIKGINLSANWQRLGLRLVPHEGIKNKITALFIIEANQLGLEINSLRIKDHQHKFIGEIGGDKFFINLEESSNPVQIYVPIEIELNSLVNSARFLVKPIESNISTIDLSAGWSAPLKLPKVKVTVNGRNSYLQATQVERTLKREIPNILSGIQESLAEYLSNEGTLALENKLNEVAGSGYEDYTTLPILFNPAEENLEQENTDLEDKAILGTKLSEIGMRENHFKIRFDNFIEDGKNHSNYFVDPQLRAKNELDQKFLKETNYDAVAAVNIGLINQYLKISCDRGYLSKIELGDETIELEDCPFAKVNERNNEVRLSISIVQRPQFSWYEFIDRNAIRSRIVVQMELGLRLTKNKNKKIGLQLTQLYPETVSIAPLYINYATDAVHDSAREQVRAMNNDLRSMMIMDDLPLPTDLMGIKFEYLKTKYDNNGNIVFYLKTNLTQ